MPNSSKDDDSICGKRGILSPSLFDILLIYAVNNDELICVMVFVMLLVIISFLEDII